MKIRSIWMGLFLFAVEAHSAPATLRPQDFTLDHDDAASAAQVGVIPSEESGGVGSPISWQSFMASLSGSSAVTFGIDLMGALSYQRNSSDPMVPASVQKLVTTASAFKNLGADTTFPNYFEAQISGDVASQIKFTVSGDPTWGHSEYETFDSRLDKVIAQLKAQGVTKITGDITIVSTRPELDQIARPSGWPSRWLLQCMATMPSSFMMNGNCGSFTVTSTTHAEWITPGVDLPIHLNVYEGSSNDLSVTPEQDSLGRITGYNVSGRFHSATSKFIDPNNIELGAETETVPVYFGTRWLKNLFIEALASHSIHYDASGDTVSGKSMMVDLSSLPMRDILQTGVQQSINGILDRTFFEISHVLNLTNGSDASYAILKEVIGDDSYLTHVDIYDGCGLDVNDRLRPDTLYQFLSGLKRQPYFSDFKSVLAEAGVSGTLKDRLTGPLTNKKVFGKTGTIDQYYNLVGYFQTPSQTLEPFTLFTSSNDAAITVRNMLDKIVTQFARLNTP
jgi:D-alanyl-D-alanine carboxypeptidase/D-alanyl-D-alanine-endopeptidase (penicillin-binding protein 4)